jgi:CheY-like chemotaxis protein
MCHWNNMPTILIIDDDPVFLSNLAQLLEFEDFRVIASVNGHDAIASLQVRSVDLILCDMLMQPMNGFEILQAIHQNLKTAQVPFVFITGVQWNSADVDVTGVADYLIKPFTTDKLLEVIRSQLGM